MAKVLAQQPSSPKGAFCEAVKSLKEILGEEAATAKEIADGFVKVLELLECLPVEKPVYAAAKTVLMANFRAVCREFLDGKSGMDVRRAAAKDIDIHGKKVALYAWA